MTPDLDLDDLVAPIREDNVSGASELSHTAAGILIRVAREAPVGSLEELARELTEAGREVILAQPSMAPMVTLVRRVLGALEGTGSVGAVESVAAAGSVERGREAAARAAQDFMDGLEARVAAVVHAAAEVLPKRGTVATISASGTVRALLEAEAAPRDIRVVCFESRPMNEGRRLAEALAEAGVRVTHAVDAAIDSLVPECDIVVFGTDSIGDRGVVNKIGSRALARTANGVGVPVYVLADETKLLPKGYPQRVDDRRPPEEVWAGAPEEITIWNRYFEVVPVALVTGVVMERGLLRPAELLDTRTALDPSGSNDASAWLDGS